MRNIGPWCAGAVRALRGQSRLEVALAAGVVIAIGLAALSLGHALRANKRVAVLMARVDTLMSLPDQVTGQGRHVTALADQYAELREDAARQAEEMLNQFRAGRRDLEEIARHYQAAFTDHASALQENNGRTVEALLKELQDTRLAVNEYLEKYKWLSARAMLADRSRKVASPIDVRELRARMDVLETSLRQHRVSLAEIIKQLEEPADVTVRR